jgi:hypothetical protein
MDEPTIDSLKAAGTNWEDTLPPEDVQKLFEVRAYLKTFEEEEQMPAVMERVTAWAQTFEKDGVHSDARDHVLFQLLIGGTPRTSMTKVDYADGSILSFARQLNHDLHPGRSRG